MIVTETEARAWLAQLPEWNALAQERIETLLRLLAEENKRQNLVAAASLDTAWQRHVLDSAQLLGLVPRETLGSWLDLGTGAGFPGLVISVLCPDLPMTLVESRAKRAEWLEQIRAELGLEQCAVFGGKLEALPTATFAAISARAFAPLPKLLDLSARFSTSDTQFVLPKGRSARQELQELTGWRHRFHVEQSLTDEEAGIIVGQLLGRKGK